MSRRSIMPSTSGTCTANLGPVPCLTGNNNLSYTCSEQGYNQFSNTPKYESASAACQAGLTHTGRAPLSGCGPHSRLCLNADGRPITLDATSVAVTGGVVTGGVVSGGVVSGGEGTGGVVSGGGNGGVVSGGGNGGVVSGGGSGGGVVTGGIQSYGWITIVIVLVLALVGLLVWILTLVKTYKTWSGAKGFVGMITAFFPLTTPIMTSLLLLKV
jgi:hypothetical protein